MNNDISRLIKAYTKSELAHLYNPTLTYQASLRMLKKWIEFNGKLMEELTLNGYCPGNRIYTPKQVEIIFKHLGEP